MGEAEDFRRALGDGDFKRHTWFFYGGVVGFVVGFLLLRSGSPVGLSLGAVCFFFSARYALKAGRALNIGKSYDSLTTREYEQLDPHQRLARARRVAVILVTFGVFAIGLDVFLVFARAGSPHTQTVFQLLGLIAD
jgi:uncharacterized membrane protein